MRIGISVVVEPDGDEFHAYCPAFKGLHVYGKTPGEAIERTGAALRWYLDSLERHGDPLPAGSDCMVDAAPRGAS